MLANLQGTARRPVPTGVLQRLQLYTRDHTPREGGIHSPPREAQDGVKLIRVDHHVLDLA